MLQSFNGVGPMLDARLKQGVALARRRQMGRVIATQDQRLHFDSLDADQQGRAVTACLMAKHIGLMVPTGLRADSERWAVGHLSGKETRGLAPTLAAVRADAVGSTGGGMSDLDSVFTFGEIIAGLSAPIQGSEFIPVRTNLPMGAQAVRHRRRGTTGTHLPISNNGGRFGNAAYDITSKTTDMVWYGTESEVWQMEQIDGEFAGYNPQQLIEASTRMVVAQTQENILWNGDAATGLQGILNYDQLATSLGTTLDLSDVETVVATITGKVTQIMRASKNAMTVDLVVVSDRIMDVLARPRTGVAQTGLEALMNALQAITGGPVKVRAAFRLNTAGPASQDGILYLDSRHGESGLHQIALGPLVIPVPEGIKVKLYYVTKQGGVAQHFEHAASLVWHAISG